MTAMPRPTVAATSASRRQRAMPLFYVTIYPVLWVLFWPLRASRKKNNPEEYEATRQKFAKK